MARRLGAVLLALAAVVGSVAPPAFGQAYACPGVRRSVTPYAFEQITVSTTAVGFTHATYSTGGATPALAVVVLETASVRYRDDGTAPTATVGTPAGSGSVVVVCDLAIGRWKAIRSGAADAVANVSYYR